MKKFQKNYKKKPFKNKCIVQNDQKFESTNREILELKFEENSISDEESEENEHISDEDEENDYSEKDDGLMKREDFNIKLFMLVII